MCYVVELFRVKFLSLHIQNKAIEKYFPRRCLLRNRPYEVVSVLELWIKLPLFKHNYSCWAVLSCGAVYYAVQDASNFRLSGRNRKV